MLQNYDVDIKDFISLTNAGLKVADFVQIKAALIRRYKETYGSDIDLSTASADGIFVSDLALIINNILKTVSTLYSNLDVNSASGVYLDLLCRLSNVKRRLASNSYASILITNLSTTSNITIPARVEAFDKAGQQWTGDNVETELAPGESLAVIVTCDTVGAVLAPAGDISQLVDATLNVSVVQENDAVVGSLDESDDDLRERRSQSNGAQGITVLESLYGALRQLASVVDVKIYNNASSQESTAPLDGTVIGKHDIYIILRLKEQIVVNAEELGTLIYEKLTPGISTTKFVGSTLEPTSFDEIKQVWSNSNGISGEYLYIPTIIGSSVEVFQQSVYWKQAKGFATPITFTLKKASYFANTTPEVVAKTMMSYFNDLSIGQTPSEFDVRLALMDSDPQFKTKSTFSVENISAIPQNLDTYYNYTTFSVQNGLEADTIEITLS